MAANISFIFLLHAPVLLLLSVAANDIQNFFAVAIETADEDANNRLAQKSNIRDSFYLQGIFISPLRV